MTDKNGEIAARYEYDEWGLVTRMYNRHGERIREGIGWMGDLNTGNGTLGSRLGPTEDDDDIDYHPGNGKGKGNEKAKGTEKNKNKGNKEDIEELDSPTTQETESTTESDSNSNGGTVTSDVYDAGTTESYDEEVTEDITTELVKENPYRYRHYYWDRKTQFYYLQTRYYNPRIARFISMDPWRGEVQSPLSLNRYVYTYNNPINYSDPSGLCVLCGDLKDLPVRDGTFEPVSVKAEIKKIGDTIYVVLKLPMTFSYSIVEMATEDAKEFVKNYLISLDFNNEYTDEEENAASRRLAEIHAQYYSGGAVSSIGTRIIRKASTQLVNEARIVTQTAERKAFNQVVDSEVPRMDLQFFANKGKDKTKHGEYRANQRGFSNEKINDIVNNIVNNYSQKVYQSINS